MGTFTLVARRADCNNGAGCSPATGNNFGTVTITDVATNVVSVDVDLWNSFTWAKTGLIGFAFNLVSGLQVQYFALAWRNVELDANIRQSPHRLQYRRDGHRSVSVRKHFESFESFVI
jgi:hypothetical protein